MHREADWRQFAASSRRIALVQKWVHHKGLSPRKRRVNEYQNMKHGALLFGTLLSLGGSSGQSLDQLPLTNDDKNQNRKQLQARRREKHTPFNAVK